MEQRKPEGCLVTFAIPTGAYFSLAHIQTDWKLIDVGDVAIVVGYLHFDKQPFFNELAILLTINGIVWLKTVDIWRLRMIHEG